MAVLGSVAVTRLWNNVKNLVANAVKDKADSSAVTAVSGRVETIEGDYLKAEDISGLQERLTFDSAPTSGSPNAITSGAVYSAIANMPTDGAVTALVGRVEAIESNYATKSDIGNMLRWKGSVDTYENLPTNAEIGDTYSVESVYGTHPAGTNFAWTGTKWDDYGNGFEIVELTADEIDAICV